MKKLVKNRRMRVRWLLSAAILALWQRLVSSNKALHLLYQTMRAVLYQRTTTAIKMASKVYPIFCHRFVCCCPGSRWGDTEWVVARWQQRPVASGGSPGHSASGNAVCIAPMHSHGHQKGLQLRCICFSPPHFLLTVIIAKDHVMVD